MSGNCGRYELLGEIGRGGMGIVYRAIDPKVNHIVAVKKLVLENIAPEKRDEFKDRFVREAHTISKLKHPNIVDVLDVSLEDDCYFYVMEYLDGESLRKDLLRRGGKMPISNFLPILSQVGEALSFAHSMSIVHRDVKPDNIFILKNGRVKLTDFGIARAAEFEDANLTKTGIMMGTLAYVSPEQLQDAKSVDHRADIFSLGVVAYESISGTLPFTADGIAATIVKIISQEERPLHIIDAEISPGISSSVGRAMRKKPRERYRSVAEFVKDFSDNVPPHERGAVPTLAPPRENSSAGIDLKPYTPVKTQFGITSVDFDSHIREVDGLKPSSEAHTQTSSPFGAGAAQPLDVTVAGDNNIDKFKTDTFKTDTFDSGDLLNTRSEIPARSSDYSQKPPAMFAAVPVASLKPKRHPESLNYVTTLANQNAYNALPGKAKPFMEPAVLACHSGRLAVADGAARTINVYSYDGANLEGTLRWLFEVQHQSQTKGQDNSRTKCGRLTRPGGLAFDMKGRLFVCDASDQYIRVFDGKGFFQSEFKNIQAKDSGLAGITFDTSGLLYVSDSANACIQVFQPETGVWLRSINTRSDLGQRRSGTSYGSPDLGASGNEAQGGKNAQITELRLPAGLCADRLNQVYLADYGASHVFVFNKQGQVVKHFGRKGGADGDLNIPRAVAVDKFARIYVWDSFNNRLSVFDAGGNFIYTYGTEQDETPPADRLTTPSDIAIDHQHGLVFVADRGNKRVQILRMREEANYGARF